MCGITGIFSSQHVNNIEKRIIEMNNSISHRGPDASGYHLCSKTLALGHKRLSIIDLDSRSNQPMFSNSEKSIIVFNGEIFNFIEIRNQLKDKYKFTTLSDTEVILASIEINGIDWFLERANGMFAFAYYNFQKGELILVRDRFGIKPLFYTIVDDTLIFASEIKGILNSGLVNAVFNENAIDEYLGNRYVREPFTFFENIFQVKSASYTVFRSDLSSIDKIYWQLPSLNFDTVYDEKEILAATNIEIENAIERWFISDVPVGAYLSGGIDSSLISFFLAQKSKKPIRTYTIGFGEKGYNEFEFARIVSKAIKSEHQEIILEKNDYFSIIERLIYFKDAPLAVPNEIPLAIMSTELSKDITVVMSGEGADELFGGYGRIFRSAFDFENRPNKDKLSFYDYFINKYDYVDRKIRDKFLNVKTSYREIFDNEIANDFTFYRNEENIFRFFHNYHIKGLLNRVDMTTMQTSVEARPPFLDHELIEFVYTKVPYKMKLKWNDDYSRDLAKSYSAEFYSEKFDIPKYVLKKISEDYLPKDIIYRKKVGFPVPLTNWFPEILHESKKELENVYWLKNNSLNELFLELEKSEKSGQLLWMFLNIEIFRKKYFNKNWKW